MNILFVISNFQKHGPILQLYYLCKNIDKSFFKIFVVTTTKYKHDGSLYDNFKSLDIEIVEFNANKILSIFYLKHKLQLFINQKHINCVHSFGFRSDFFCFRLKNIVKITTIRHTFPLIYTLNYGTFFGNILSYLNIYFIKKFDSVISVSNSVNYYSRRYGIRSKVIHNSIDFNFVNNKLNISSKIDLRNKLNLENKVTFISISSRLYGKNIDFLTESFKNNYFDNYILLIAGHVKKSLKIKYFNNTNIIFLDNINNVEEYIKASDYFISASLHEGFPNAVLESMALGTPVILSNIKSHLEFFTDNRLLIGDYFINNNINDLKFKINKITNYNYEYLSNNCIININNNFNSKVITKEYELFYKKINNDLSRFTKL